MKYCSKCKTKKPTTDFGKNKSTKDNLQRYCKICQRQLVKEHHRNNKDFYRKKAHNNRSKYQKEAREYIYEFLLKNHCVDCGESDPIMLEFDHINPKEKEHTISHMIGSFTLDKIKLEIEKCEIRCANCHKVRTAYQFGWWIAKMNEEVFNNLCSSCGEVISKDFNNCYRCLRNTDKKVIKPKPKNKINWPNISDLVKKIEKSSYTSVAKELGVSDNAVRKHVKSKLGKVIKTKYSKRSDSSKG